MNEYIDSAVAQFKTLLEEQLARTGRMENAAAPKDFTKLPVVTVGVIDGDGIGPIISKQTT
ncbi:MAG: isocitrate/isopropylmalate dehydrogenase family protein, partial [Clostridia bacterium]|nr:isocitrate/isopropylmalate dehydrogenase family protein [Clostridia bacterium]